MKLFNFLLVSFIVVVILSGCTNKNESHAQKFISEYSDTFQQLRYTAVKAAWLANTDIKEENTEKEKGRICPFPCLQCVQWFECKVYVSKLPEFVFYLLYYAKGQ